MAYRFNKSGSGHSGSKTALEVSSAIVSLFIPRVSLTPGTWGRGEGEEGAVVREGEACP